jgi:hypothetical protein
MQKRMLTLYLDEDTIERIDRIKDISKSVPSRNALLTMWILKACDREERRVSGNSERSDAGARVSVRTARQRVA